MNRFGGDLFLGVLDDGTVVGVPEKAAPAMIKNFISCVSNKDLFSPTIYLSPEIITYEGKTIIHIFVPPSAEVHTYKKVIYDRVDDADVKVTATAQIAQMFIRKQDIFTEQKIYPYVGLENLHLEMLPKLRTRARNNTANGQHPWDSMTDEELMRSAHLYGRDRATGKEGFNLAAVLLLGTDDVIMDVVPAYVTDALLRRQNVDRYDDREIVKTNLIDSFDRLMAFGRKHLPDKFFLEGNQRISLREIITREMIANTLIHREFTSTYQAKFVIENEKMYVENASRASKSGLVTPDNVEPNPKNPIIAGFFRNIGLADQLGSGVRNLFKYSRAYAGGEPEFEEGDVFRISVPLDNSTQITPKVNPSRTQGQPELHPGEIQGETQMAVELGGREKKIVDLISANPRLSQREVAEKLELNVNTVKTLVRKLKAKGIISREGTSQNGHWIVHTKEMTTSGG